MKPRGPSRDFEVERHNMKNAEQLHEPGPSQRKPRIYVCVTEWAKSGPSTLLADWSSIVES